VEDRERVWRLYRGEDLVADLVVTGGDFPWLQARVEPRPPFDEVQELFAEDLRLMDRDDPEGVAAWEAVQDRIRQTLVLEYPDGGRIPEFLLHIENESAWWRWSDEPFE
jgi:hypothetical protein